MDVSKLINEGFDAVKEYVDRGFQSLVARLESIEAKQPLKGEPGRDGVDGKDGAPGVDGKDGLNGKDGADGLAGKDGLNGKDAAPGERGLPGEKGEPGLNGKDGADGLAGKDGRDGLNGKDGTDGLNGKDAESVTREMILDAIKSDPSLIGEAVALHLRDNPVRAGVDGKPGERGEKGDPGRDGVNGAGVASAMIDRDGNLALTLSDGKAVSLGPVVGKDGAPGKDGSAGKDGFGFDDMTATHDGQRGLTLTFVKGDVKKEFRFDVGGVVDRGVWREGEFKAGDAVTWDGSLFIAQADTSKKPGLPDSGWRLAAKRGRDGASAFDLAKRAGFKGGEAEWLASLKGERGPEGQRGRDLTQLGFDGRKS